MMLLKDILHLKLAGITSDNLIDQLESHNPCLTYLFGRWNECLDCEFLRYLKGYYQRWSKIPDFLFRRKPNV